VQRIGPDRLRDVLELRRAEIGDREIEPPLDLTIGVLRQTDRARFGDALKAGSEVDAVAHEIAVRLLDHVAEVNADAKLNASFRRQAGFALDHAVLHLDCATHGVNHAAELDDAAITGALDVMGGDCGIDQVAAQCTQSCQSSILVRARESAVADHVRDQDRRDFARFPHGAPSGRHSE
jgi:hypothetical protein